MIYQYEEIELTLKLSYFAKIHLRELENILQIDNDRKYNQDYIFYTYIVYIVDFWLNSLFPDEQKIIFLRIFEKKTYDCIAIETGYSNHSSIVRKYKKIVKKILYLCSEVCYTEFIFF